jgi:hypothetical protein
MPTTRIPLVDEAPLVDDLTAYDEAHFTLYMRLLDAIAAGATEPEICIELLGIDATREPERAHKRFESHVRRASWFLADGSRHLFDRDTYPSKSASA